MRAEKIANVLAQIVVSVGPGPAVSIVPTDADLNNALTNNRATWYGFIANHINDFIEPRYRGLPAPWDTPQKIRQLMRASGTVTFTEPAVNTLPGSQNHRLDYKLHGQSGNDITEGFRLLIDYIDSRFLPDFATRNDAAKAIKHLTALEAFFIRITAAVKAAAAANVTLANALALYRTEGDLVVPISQKRLADRLPSFENNFKFSLNDAEILRPTLKFGLWSFPINRLFGNWLQDTPANINNAKSIALQTWCFATTGFDFVFRQTLTLKPTLQVLQNKLPAFMHQNRISLGIASVKDDRKAEVNAVIADLDHVWPTSAAGRIIVVPKDPVKLVEFILREALIFFQAHGILVDGPAITPNTALKYLAYHTQWTRSVLPAGDKFTWVLISAAVAAAKKSPAKPAFAALHASLQGMGLPGNLSKDPKVDSTDHVDAFNKLNAANWWSVAANLSNLADFILAADLSDWSGWNKQNESIRANIARYARLLEYYRGLIS